jgi:hypothetical protein
MDIDEPRVKNKPDETHQKVVDSTMILTVPGHRARFVNVSSTSIATSSSSSVDANSSSETSAEPHSSSSHGGEPEERNMPDAAAVSTSGEEMLSNIDVNVVGTLYIRKVTDEDCCVW